MFWSLMTFLSDISYLGVTFAFFSVLTLSDGWQQRYIQSVEWLLILWPSYMELSTTDSSWFIDVTDSVLRSTKDWNVLQSLW